MYSLAKCYALSRGGFANYLPLPHSGLRGRWGNVLPAFYYPFIYAMSSPMSPKSFSRHFYSNAVHPPYVSIIFFPIAMLLHVMSHDVVHPASLRTPHPFTLRALAIRVVFIIIIFTAVGCRLVFHSYAANWMRNGENCCRCRWLRGICKSLIHVFIVSAGSTFVARTHPPPPSSPPAASDQF